MPPSPRRQLLRVDGKEVALLEVAPTRRDRARGLLGRDGIDGALLLVPAASVHTIGMRFPIDVALCTRSLEVVAVRTLVPWRATRPRLGARVVLEAEAGAFERWGLHPGGQLSISEWPP
jgi:uncharacterized protein